MATVVWTGKAKIARRKLYIEGVVNYDIATAIKIVHRIESIARELEYFLESGYQEPLLAGQVCEYRARHINKRFKIIYWFNKKDDIVVVEDIWDTHRAPWNLVKRLSIDH